MKNYWKALVWILLVSLLMGNSTAFFWPWSFLFPGTGTTTTTATVGTASINYGFLRPAVFVNVPTTTTAATTTTTTTPRSQLFINALLGSALPVNNSFLVSIAQALNRPVIGGVAQPFPGVIGGGITGGIPSSPVVGGIAAPIGGAAVGTGGGLVLPPGFPAAGGVAASGILPGLFPGIIGRSNKGREREVISKNPQKPSGGKVVFAERK